MHLDADLNFLADSGHHRVYPLQIIATKGDMQMLDLVLKNSKLNINATDETGVNAFWMAARFGHGEIMRKLASHGCDVLVTNKKGTNAMHLAVLRNFPPIVELLIESGFPFELANNDGMTPFHLAA